MTLKFKYLNNKKEFIIMSYISSFYKNYSFKKNDY